VTNVKANYKYVVEGYVKYVRCYVCIKLNN